MKGWKGGGGVTCCRAGRRGSDYFTYPLPSSNSSTNTRAQVARALCGNAGPTHFPTVSRLRHGPGTHLAEGENVSKLEKADILELTVRHLHKLRRQQRLSSNPVTDADRFRAGFTHCATEVSRCLAATPGVDVHLGTKLMTHLGHRLNDMDKTLPLSVQVGSAHAGTPPGSPAAPLSACSDEDDGGASTPVTAYYAMPLTPASSTTSSGCARNSNSPASMTYSAGGLLKSSEPVWRPW
uniref:Orange domain-containing protein n=1 Tax=Timema shepardi TaxID=629360 RepID=A0A7R9B4F8_TIMSH|nr:unnamed protein product [Timema shepardi]